MAQLVRQYVLEVLRAHALQVHRDARAQHAVQAAALQRLAHVHLRRTPDAQPGAQRHVHRPLVRRQAAHAPPAHILAKCRVRPYRVCACGARAGQPDAQRDLPPGHPHAPDGLRRTGLRRRAGLRRPDVPRSRGALRRRARLRRRCVSLRQPRRNRHADLHGQQQPERHHQPQRVLHARPQQPAPAGEQQQRDQQRRADACAQQPCQHRAHSLPRRFASSSMRESSSISCSSSAPPSTRLETSRSALPPKRRPTSAVVCSRCTSSRRISGW